MALTYDPIATVSLSGVGTYTFTSLPQTYTDLRLVATTGYDSGGGGLNIRVNGNTASNYYQMYYYASQVTNTNVLSNGFGTIPTTTTFSPAIAEPNVSSSPLSVHIVDFFNYANAYLASANIKNVSRQTAITDIASNYAYIYHSQMAWNQTAAISSITIFQTGNFNANAKATLFGIAKA